MYEYIVIIGLILGAGFFVINPLLSRKEGYSAANTEDMLAQLNLKKENAYAAIRELEFDLSMKKLSKEDFDSLKAQYVHDALECMKRIDELDLQRKRRAGLPEKDLENEIEKEISDLRTGSISGPAEIYCTRCGQGTSSKDRFCARCGEQLATS